MRSFWIIIWAFVIFCDAATEDDDDDNQSESILDDDPLGAVPSTDQEVAKILDDMLEDLVANRLEVVLDEARVAVQRLAVPYGAYGWSIISGSWIELATMHMDRDLRFKFNNGSLFQTGFVAFYGLGFGLPWLVDYSSNPEHLLDVQASDILDHHGLNKDGGKLYKILIQEGGALMILDDDKFIRTKLEEFILDAHDKIKDFRRGKDEPIEVFDLVATIEAIHKIANLKLDLIIRMRSSKRPVQAVVDRDL